MAKTMTIDGVVYVEKEEYEKEIFNKKTGKWCQFKEEQLTEILLETSDYSFARIVKEVAKQKVDDIAYFDIDIFKEGEDYNYNDKEIQKKLAIIALSL